eukprot:800463-Pelagomonas_calceolata.AAC.1
MKIWMKRKYDSLSSLIGTKNNVSGVSAPVVLALGCGPGSFSRAVRHWGQGTAEQEEESPLWTLRGVTPRRRMADNNPPDPY